jgi:hypothetical protein
MKHLREVDNDGVFNETKTGNKKIRLDENEITESQLHELMGKQKVGERIVEVAPGNWKTLHRLNG